MQNQSYLKKNYLLRFYLKKQPKNNNLQEKEESTKKEILIENQNLGKNMMNG